MVGLFAFAFLQEDSLTLLEKIDCPWHVPADALYQAIAMHGWTVEDGPLPSRKTSCCDAWTCTVTISDRLIEELDYPHLYKEIRNWILACALGHIRLYSGAILQGQSGAALDESAHSYALAFLLPEAMLRSHSELPFIEQRQPNGNECWKAMGRIAETFKVPIKSVQAALERYGILTQPLEFRQAA